MPREIDEDGTGRVSYHPVPSFHAPARAGLAMSWGLRNGRIKVVGVFDHIKDGAFTSCVVVRSPEMVLPAIAAWTERVAHRGGDARMLSYLFPGPGPTDGRHRDSLPPLDEHRAAALRAIQGNPWIPGPMRAAFLAFLDHGVTDLANRIHTSSSDAWRRRNNSPAGVTGRPDWGALAFAAKHPVVAELAMAAGPPIGGDDPMPSLLARWPGITTAHLRWAPEPDLRTVMSTMGERYAGYCLDLAFAVPVDWLPGSEEWPSFVTVATCVGRMRNFCGEALRIRSLVSASKGRWVDLARRLHEAADIAVEAQGPVPGALLTLCDTALDPSRQLAWQVVIPLAAHIRAAEGDAGSIHKFPFSVFLSAATSLLYGSKSAPNVIGTSGRWHRMHEAIDARVRIGSGARDWPPLFDGPFREGDIEIVAISDSTALGEEGARGADRAGIPGLHHCVASRLSLCLSGKAHILSVRRRDADGSFRRISTCQLALVDGSSGSPKFQEVEHRGRANVTPCEDSRHAVKRLLAAIQSGEMRIRPEVLVAQAPIHEDTTSTNCGYDWRSQAAVANAIAAWEPLLPRWARGLGPRDVHDALVSRALVPAPSDHPPGHPYPPCPPSPPRP